MIKIENVKVYGWEAAIRGMRNPRNSWEKSDTTFYGAGEYWDIVGNSGPTDKDYNMVIGYHDHDLMLRLAKAGPVHGKFRRMITTTMDITAPLYWWKEFDTYKVGTVANSCSTMHKIQAKEFTLEDFSFEHLIYAEQVKKLETEDEDYMEEGFMLLSEMVRDENFEFPIEYDDKLFLYPEDILRGVITMLNTCRKQYLVTGDKIYWWQMIQLLPSSYNQRRTVQLNYETLSNIYIYRREHKLDEWRDFCKMIEGLPYSESITCNAVM